MAKIHGARAFFSIVDFGGVVRDISNQCDNIDFPRQADNNDASGFGDGWRTFLPGLKGATFNVSGKPGFGANEVDAVMSALLGGGDAGTARPAWVYGPDGTATGKTKYTGNAYLTAYNISQPLADVVKWTGTVQIDGTPTRTTF